MAEKPIKCPTLSSVDYQYFDNGLVKQIDTGASKSDYTCNDRNQLKTEVQILAGAPARTVSYDYDDDGLRTDLTYPSTRLVESAWTARDQIEDVDHGVTNPEGAAGPLIADQKFVYDDMGNRTSFVVTSAGASSNILAGTTGYTPDDKNQYDSITGPSSPPQGTWLYDLDGNLTDDGTRLFVWDAWNRLREVKLKSTGALLASYQYDSMGRRISKTTATEVTAFIYDGWNVIQEYTRSVDDPPANPPALFQLHAYLVWGEGLSGSLQGAGGVGGLLMRAASDGTAYYHYDANGNPARLATATGSWAGKYRYDAFGNVREEVGTLAATNPWQFSTKYRDEESGFSYYGYRYYDPVTGRWPSRDPIGERGGINLYGFVGNDGMNWWDILGLEGVCECVELQFSQREIEHHGPLWLLMREVLSLVPGGGSVPMGGIGDIQGSVDWKPEAGDSDHPCCKIKNDNSDVRMRIEGQFTPEGGSDLEDIYFFLGQDYMNIYPFGVEQPDQSFWTGPSGTPRLDRFYPRNNRGGTAKYDLYVGGDLCETKKLTFK